ncbi:MAG TPA: ParB/RepB/Spo0J family partition protein, partial [Thermomicrobiales bacterium]|nr:ParB/RepB/Spo0J family partition protein [Thermomicrobiales bacterium]
AVPGHSKSRRRFTVDALFSDSRAQAVGVSDLPTAKEIRLDRIEPDPEQPRRTFDEAKLAELAESIRQEGILQAIAVRYDHEADRYVILHGERRWRASKLAGLPAIPAVVRDVPADRRLIQQLMENIVRDDLNAVDRAAALRALKVQLGDVPWETVAEAVGIRRSRLFQLLGTEKLPDAAREDLRSGRLNEKQSRALQGLPPIQQDVLREAIVADEIPATEAMRLAKALRGARLPDERETVTKAFAAIREGAARPATAGSASGLLALVSTGLTGSRADRAALAETVDALGAPAYSADRLEAHVHALAQMLAGLPRSEARPGGPVYATLVALAGALDVILDAAE